ncbi:MAG: MFS transporter, partial [Bacillus sp. (in: Bacteria)]|nr:MFS transporter [Bacillus sp. (in: firmicutes)]
YSSSQMVIMLATLFWGKAITYVKNKNRLIQISLCIRLIITGMMFIVEQNTLFIVLFLLYHTVSSSIDIAFEGLLARWAFANQRHFGRFRLFGSIGYASSGLVASLIYALTKDVNYLLIFIMGINLVILVGTMLFPLQVEVNKHSKRKKVQMGKKVYFLLFLGVLITTLPNSFGIVLNNHYRTSLHLSIEEAVFYGGIAILIGSFLSEGTGFFFADRLIQKFHAKNIILIGMILSIIRWILAVFAESPLFFTATYLFHGVSFVFIYLGCVTFIKEELGEESITETVINFSLLAALTGFLFTQLFLVVLSIYTTGFLLVLFIIISLIVTIFYYYCYWK